MDTAARPLSNLLILAMIIAPVAGVLSIRPNTPLSTATSSELQLNPYAAFPIPVDMKKLDFYVVTEYVTRKGEDLYSLYKKFGVEQYSIRSSNDLDFSTFSPETRLYLPNRQGTRYEVTEPESLKTISQRFSRGKQLGSVYEREILEANGYPLPNLRAEGYLFDKGNVLFLPIVRKQTGLGTPLVGPYRQTSSFGSRRHPVLGIKRKHSGLDLAKPHGSPVVPAREGVVTFAGWSGGYGNMIEIRHVLKGKNGSRILATRYGHLSKINVRVGQKVRLGQIIGRVGSTGISTGPHLHFEVRDEGGTANNPRKFL